IGHTVTGAESNTSATVETMSYSFINGQLIIELLLSNIYNDPFISGEEIYTDFIYQGNQERLAATLYSGSIISAEIINSGVGYLVGTIVPLISDNEGSGGVVEISKTTTGSIGSVGVYDGGAGFEMGDPIIVSGGGGFDASADVFSVDSSGDAHPPYYNICSTTIG